MSDTEKCRVSDSCLWQESRNLLIKNTRNELNADSIRDFFCKSLPLYQKSLARLLGYAWAVMGKVGWCWVSCEKRVDAGYGREGGRGISDIGVWEQSTEASNATAVREFLGNWEQTPLAGEPRASRETEGNIVLCVSDFIFKGTCHLFNVLKK